MVLVLSARRLKLIDIYKKFCEDSLNGFQVRADTILWLSQRKITKRYKYKSYGSCALHVV